MFEAKRVKTSSCLIVDYIYLFGMVGIQVGNLSVGSGINHNFCFSLTVISKMMGKWQKGRTSVFLPMATNVKSGATSGNTGVKVRV